MKIRRILDTTPDWENSDPNIRLRALQARLPPDLILARLASQDSDCRVRSHATGHLNDRELLIVLCEDKDPNIVDLARQRWVQLFMAEPAGATPPLDTITNETLLAAIVTFADSIDIRLESLDKVNDHKLLTYILDRDNHTRVHQACAGRITNEETLEYLLPRLRGKDKNVGRILRQKLDAIKQARQQSAALQDRCAKLQESFQHLSSGAHHEAFERRFAVLNDEWQEIASTHPEEVAEVTRSQIEAARRRCADLVNAMTQRREEQRAIVKQAVEQLESLSGQLATSADDLPELAMKLGRIRTLWPADFGEDQDIARRYHALIAPLEKLAAQYALCMKLPGNNASIGELKSGLARINWPDGWCEPVRVTEAKYRLQSMLDEDAKRKAQVEREVAQVTDQLERLEAVIAQGKLRAADKLYRSLRKRFEAPPIHMPAHATDKLTILAQQLRELQDWQGYVTVPKRNELCEQMETLRDDPGIPPPEKAKSIKDLQQRWKKLGPSNDHHSQQLWARFKQAADAAFKPCADYFSHQRQVREQNLSERTKICDSLETLYAQVDWDSADWKGVNDIIIRARREWRQYEDVPHASRNQIHARYTEIIKRFDQQISAEKTRNHVRKQALIDGLKSLLEQSESEPGSASLISEAKQAQSLWQQVGITDRKVDQRMWKAFRQQCDSIFKLRDEQSERDKAALDASKSAAWEVSNKLKQLIAAKDFDRAQLRSIRHEFDTVAPDKAGADVTREFKRHVQQAEQALKEQAIASRRNSIDEVRRRANICLKLERGEINIEAAEAEWSSDVEIDAALLTCLDARKSAAADPDASAQEANCKVASLLCVRIEIMAELSSPPEAQAVRMQYQVDRLNRELSKGQKETRPMQQQLQDLLVKWYSLGALPNDANELRRRFQRAEEKLAV